MASPLTVIIPHDLGKTEARARITRGLEQFESQAFGRQFGQFENMAWTDDRLSFQARGFGQRMSGRIDVGDREIRIEVDLPRFLAAFSDKISGKLQREGRLLLE